jgi:hypothetical protein
VVHRVKKNKQIVIQKDKLAAIGACFVTTNIRDIYSYKLAGSKCSSLAGRYSPVHCHVFVAILGL